MVLLSSLQLEYHNSGTSTGSHWWCETQGAGDIVSYNPSTAEPIASVHCAIAADYERVIKEAQQAFLLWRNVPAPQRGEVIRAIGDELRRHKLALGQLVSLEMGKSLQEGIGEVQEMIDMADFAVGQSRMLYGKTMHSERPEHRMYEQWHPLGIVGVVTAFNFPVAVWAWNAFIAAVCGDVIIWKPSPKTPLCAVAVQHICNRVMDQFGYRAIFSLFICSNHSPLVKNIATDTRIPLVSFTGSTTIGKEYNTLVAGRLGRSLLELSGNNAVILTEESDLAAAIPSIVFGAIGTAGQRCTTTRRLIVHTSIYKKVVDALVDSYQKITIGDPLDEKNLLGPLIDEHAVQQFMETVAAAKKQGGTILCGGNVIDRPGYFVEPTLIEAQNDWEIVQKETFAPILYIISYQTPEEAIAINNHSRFGLSSALFTQNLSQAELFLSAGGSDCGIANINIGTSGAEIGGAFGGEKDTGGGREAGSDAWKIYMRRQTNTIHWGKAPVLAQGIKFQVEN